LQNSRQEAAEFSKAANIAPYESVTEPISLVATKIPSLFSAEEDNFLRAPMRQSHAGSSPSGIQTQPDVASECHLPEAGRKLVRALLGIAALWAVIDILLYPLKHP
jgi:hypothetical protein